ncbi:MAG: excinuclease ABC subunit UvrC [Nitrososphaeraceae archaeon]
MSLEQKIIHVPDGPGVYFMKDQSGRIIYIGKAKNLKKRLKSYVVNKVDDGYHSIKTARLLSRVADIDFVVTLNETEAFLLESSLIKQYRPMFNIELKYQQKYTYLKITQEEFPRLLVARRNRNGDFFGPKGKVYGPFVYGSSKILSTGSLRRLFKVRICKKLPKKPCLEFFIKNCEAPCIGNVTKEQYMDKVAMLHEVLTKRSDMESLKSRLKEEMTEASRNHKYEQAKDLRDTIQRLENITVKQKIEANSNRGADEEFFGIMKNEDIGVAHVLTLKRRKGVIMDRNHTRFHIVGDNSLSTFISQYYHSNSTIPRYIFTNERIQEADALKEYLETISGHKVSILPVQKGLHHDDRNKIMDLIMTNLILYVEQGYHPSLLNLRNKLQLNSIPYIIDCFDVSNLGTSIAVGACVRFVNGECSKSGYRKFRIQNKGIQNDFVMIEEIVRRRYRPDSVESVSKGLPLPDMILIDGGKGQLNCAIRTLRSLGLEIPCISLAKGNEEIYTIGRKWPLILPANDEGLKLLRYVRDESHRFGLKYNINIRRNTVGI